MGLTPRLRCYPEKILLSGIVPRDVEIAEAAAAG
jgi:hypothetical protein